MKRHGHRNYIGSDHRPIEITLKFDSFKEGKGLWRHKDKLLHDIDYHVYIKRVICDTLAKYIIMPGYENFYEILLITKFEPPCKENSRANNYA